MTAAAAKVKTLPLAPFQRGDHVELAEHLIRGLRSEGVTTFTDGRFYRYDRKRGIFDLLEPAELSRTVQGFAGKKVQGAKKPLSLRASDINGTIKLASDQAFELDFFADARPGVAFCDCFVEVTEERIIQREHSSKHRARFAYPFGYQRCQPESFIGFLHDVFRDDSDAAEKVQLLQEYLGVSLLGLATKYQRALVLVGEGSNGKSVLMNVAERCMPPGSVCSVPPQMMSDQYQRAKMAGKLLNIVSELPEADILDAEAWKAIIDGSTINARPIREAPFDFKPVAGHVYAANRLPGTSDQTHGFWRRPVVVTFNRVFTPDEQNPNLADELGEEIPAIVSWLLSGAQRAIRQNGFTIPESSIAAMKAWKQKADQVLGFIEDWTQPLEAHQAIHDGARAEDLYKAYRSWALDNGHRPLASNSFGERMKQAGFPSKHTRIGGFYPVKLARNF